MNQRQQSEDPGRALTVIKREIEATRGTFMNVLADRSMNFEREAGFALQLLSAQEYTLGVALRNPQSVRNAVTNVSALGISLNPALKKAYLVPRKVNGAPSICLDISYMGLLDIAIATGSIKWGHANLVRANDVFKRRGFDQPPLHEYPEFAPVEDQGDGKPFRGECVGAYVVVKTIDGDYLTDAMVIEEILSVRDRSEAWKNGEKGPWKTDFGEMAKKTVIKRAYKTWPKTERSNRLDEAIHLLNTEGGEGLTNGPAVDAETASLVDTLIAQAQAINDDKGALDFWNAHKAQLKDPGAYGRFKDAVVAHRNALRAGGTPPPPPPPAAQKTATKGPPVDPFVMSMEEAEQRYNAERGQR